MIKRDHSKNIIVPSGNKGGWHWIGQRISAVFLTFLGLWFIVSIITGIGQTYDETIQWVRQPQNYILSLLLFLSLMIHMYLGMEVIIDDYVHISFWHTFTRFLLKVFTGILGIVYIWSLYSVVY
jgi:succinate dehydrogenase / fumarate reductase membrane anchor subunit